MNEIEPQICYSRPKKQEPKGVIIISRKKPVVKRYGDIPEFSQNITNVGEEDSQITEE